MYIKFVEARSSYVGVVWKFAEWVVGSSVSLVICLWFKITRDAIDSFCIVLNCDLNKSVEAQNARAVWLKVGVMWQFGEAVQAQGLGSNPEEGMDVYKCIVRLRYGSTLNSQRAASAVVRLVKEKRGGRPLNPRVSFLKIGEELSKTGLSPAWFSKLWLHTGVQLAPYHDEFREP
ncbi:hypothetical protein TNCV_1850341 [Trichonephila clavipes]|nr:hypothetical protein TNCV_1850341 [Trichonephila clavipes]